MILAQWLAARNGHAVKREREESLYRRAWRAIEYPGHRRTYLNQSTGDWVTVMKKNRPVDVIGWFAQAPCACARPRGDSKCTAVRFITRLLIVQLTAPVKQFRVTEQVKRA